MSNLDPLSHAVPQFLLYSRSYCHLCQDMVDDLQQFFAGRAYQVEVRDVDQEPSALALYDELVPVLLGRHGEEEWLQLCHYHLDRDKLTAWLAG